MPEWMSDSFIRKGFGLNWILGTNLGSTLMVGLFHSMWAGLSQTLPRIPETWSSVRWTDKFSLKGSWKLSCVGKRLLGGRLGRASWDQIKGMPPSYSWPPKGNLQIEIISSRHWALIVIKTGHASVLSDSLWPYGPQPVRLLCPRDSAGENTGLSCHFLLWGFFLTQGSNPGLLLCNIIGPSHLCILSVLEQQTDTEGTIATGIKTGTLAQWQLFFHCLSASPRQTRCPNKMVL